MKNETAKKLYDAGFPNLSKWENHEFVTTEDHEIDGRKGDLHTCKHCGEERFHAYSFITWSTTDLYYKGCPKAPAQYSKPDLETLIDNCGDEFADLSKWGGGWWARPTFDAVFKRDPKAEKTLEWIGYGETPREAMADLWLKLNQK